MAGIPQTETPGTDESTWAAWPGLTSLPEASAGHASVVVVAAHPDDEVLGAGGLMSLLAESRTRLRLVAVTDGEGSHVGRANPSALAWRRRTETDAALHVLGADAADVVRLGLPDSGVTAREDELATALSMLTAGFDVCLAPWEHDMHPDHEAAGRAARRSHGRVLRYPIWMWHWASPGDARVPWDRARRVPLPPRAAARKRLAIGCFASQLEDRGECMGPVLSAAMIAHFARTTEVLFS